MAGERTIRAAGGVVWRKNPDDRQQVEVLLVHRPRYGDWTFPKGKQDPGEPLAVTAAREVTEETGFGVRLGIPLPRVQYRVKAGPKTVDYWTARVTGGRFTANSEVDRILLVPVAKAADLLTYEHDRVVLDAFAELVESDRLRTGTLLVLRHGKAEGRRAWKGRDVDRPLNNLGLAQAADHVKSLHAYGIAHAVSSPALRCVTTVLPYATTRAMNVERDERLSEGAAASGVWAAVREAIGNKAPTVLCSHRPTMPDIFDAIGIAPRDLAPGEGIVLHHRRGVVIATDPLG